jgi:uncharacterized protein with ParB-like and HNH nuclease domain
MDLTEQLSNLKRKVDFSTYDMSIKELISMHSESLIDIAPEYQRSFRWDNDRQSSLIESIFLGIPFPSLFMATNKDQTWELVDGVQRLSTLIHFAGDKDARNKIGLSTNLKISGLQKLTTLNNFEFNNLSKPLQNEFLLKSLKIITLTDKSDQEVRFDLFERLNTGGVKLTEQEIRSCVYRGKFNDFLKELSKSKHFNSVIKLPKEREDDGTKEEYILRFFAFLKNYQKFEHSVKDFLNDFMKSESKKNSFSDLKSIFDSVFENLSNAQIVITGRKNLTPVNLYEGVVVGAALAYLKKKNIKKQEYSKWVKSPDLEKFTKGPTNSRPYVQGRINFCRDKFLGL